jgi:predicted ATPase
MLENLVLNSIWINSFKSYEHAELILAPLTVLIGANASGKTNAIEAIRLLSYIAQGNRLNSLKYAVYESEAAVRGTMRSLGRNGGKSFELGCTVDRGDWNFQAVAIRVSEDDELHIQNETILGEKSSFPLFQVVSPSVGDGTDIRVAYNNFARGGVKPQVTCTDQMAVMLQLQSAARFADGHRSARSIIPDVCKYFSSSLSNIQFLDPQPSAMRGYSFTSESELRGDGSNLSGVLFNLCHKSRYGDEVLNLIRSLPEQDISSVDFIHTPRGEVMLQLRETFGGEAREVDATVLSDGTLRVLAIAAGLLSAPEGGLVVIEEIDNGVHPSRSHSLLSSIESVARRRDLKVLLTSHNPALLDALPTQAVSDVVFCYRDPASGASKLVRLADLPRFPELIAQGTLGHLLTEGLIDRFVKAAPSDAERAERNSAWLESISS